MNWEISLLKSEIPMIFYSALGILLIFLLTNQTVGLISFIFRRKSLYLVQDKRPFLRMHSEDSEESQAKTFPQGLEKIHSPDYLKSLESLSLDDVLDELDEFPQELIPKEAIEILSSKVAEEAPSKWEIMKGTLGINKFTIFLAISALGILVMNWKFGNGWASELLGWSPTKVEFENSLDNPLNQEKINKMRLDSHVNIEDGIRRFKILEQNPTAFDDEGDPNFLSQFRDYEDGDLVVPDFIQPEESEVK